MAFDMLKLVGKYLPTLLGLAASILYQRIQAFIHRFTYKLLSETQNVVVIGGSFAGATLSRRLAESLPSGYRVILVERNSHFNYTFNFPRYSVTQGREHKAFVPYDGLSGSNAPEGIFEQVKDTVVGLTEEEVQLKSGKYIPYQYLAIATGVTQSPPAKLLANEKTEACHELQALQRRVQESKTIALVGAGAVGVQLAGDIKSFYPSKHVTLIHSREQLLPSFGNKLHVYVLDKLHQMGVETLLGERPVIPQASNWDKSELTLKDGRKEIYELVIPCTGQTPNSSLLDVISPSSISPQNNRVLVHPTLQLQQNAKVDGSPNLRNIFALGDVAETGGPKMARAGLLQAEVVLSNILSLIAGENLEVYKPIALEGSIKVSLGKDEYVVYAQDYDGTEFLIPGKSSEIDLEVKNIWSMLGAKLDESATSFSA